MAFEHLFQGSALNAIDAKGRLSVPAFLRSVIEKRSECKTLVLAKHDTYPCISAYDRGYAAVQHAKLERLYEREENDPAALAVYHQRNMLAFGSTEEVPYDSGGRIILPPMMRRKGGLEELALFIGSGETFQIWSPQRFLDSPDVHEDMKDIARYRLEERGVSL